MFIQIKYLVPILSLVLLSSFRLAGQTAYLTRLTEGKTTSYKIPMTKYCFVNGAELKRQWPNGWIMSWEVVKKENSSLLFMEMNSPQRISNLV